MTVLGDDTLGNIEKQHICFHACFLPFGHNPLFVIERDDVVRCKIGHVDVCQPCKAGEDENVPYQFQTLDAEILVGYLHDFFVREETTVYRLQVETMIEEGVVKEIATLLCIYGYGFESLHFLDRCIVSAACHSTQI